MNLEENIDIMRADIIKSVQEIVRIKSIESPQLAGAPFGEGVNNALTYALNLASSLGFKTVNLDGYIGYAEYGEGNEIVGVLGHLDVVPEGDGWLYDPYGGQIYNNKIYGRGTIDDKGPIIAALYGLKAIKNLGLPLNKRVRIIFGLDEESGWLDIDHYLKNDVVPDIGFTPDGMFPVINAEKGSINIEFSRNIIRKSKGMISIKSLHGGSVHNMVPEFCSCELKLKDMAKLMMKDAVELYCQKNNINISIQEKGEVHIINSRGLPSHSSQPDKGKNAITQLLMLINQFDFGQNDVGDFIKFLSKYIGSETDGRSLNISFNDDFSGELTVNLSTISIDDEKASAVVNIRYPVKAKYEDIMKNILEIASDKKIDVSVLNHRPPLYIESGSTLVTTLADVYKHITESDGCPVAIGGQTYAKAFKNMVAFGPIFPDEQGRAHMSDEYIDIDNLIKCAKIYSKAIYELAK